MSVEDRICILHFDDKPSELHFFSLPSKQSWAFTIRTINAFNTRELNAWLKAHDEGVTLPRHAEIHTPKDVHKEPQLLELNAFSHDTIWDMFKAIGYDFHKRRYIV